MFKCPRETWANCAPASERIIEDIDHLPEAISAERCIVPDDFLRRGRRARRVDNKGECKQRVRKAQRKATLKATEHHPELNMTYKALMDPTRVKAAAFFSQTFD